MSLVFCFNLFNLSKRDLLVQEKKSLGWLSSSNRERKINRRVFTFSAKPIIWSFDVVLHGKATEKCIKM